VALRLARPAGSALVRVEPKARRDMNENLPRRRPLAERVARPAGFEPAAFGSGGQRSIQLSYGRVNDQLKAITLAFSSKSVLS
jgi:hypothetical protein